MEEYDMNWKTVEQLKNIMTQSARSVLDFKIDYKIAVWTKAFVTGMAEGVYSAMMSVKDAILQLFPQNATGDFLEMWGGWENLPKNGAVEGEGTINVIGDGALSLGKTFPIDTVLQTESGLNFTATELGTIALKESDITLMTVSSGVATVTTLLAHNLATGQTPEEFSISPIGVTDCEDITVLTSTTFQFAKAWADATYTSGTIKSYQAQVDVICETTGDDTNLDAGTELTASTVIPTEINTTALAVATFTKGTDEETQEAYRARIMLARSQMIGVFTEDQITLAGLRISGNSRIYHDPPVIGAEVASKVAGFQPRPGETVVYVVIDETDGDITSPVDADILASTKASILLYGKLPAHLPEASVYCFSPLLYDIDVSVAITPDTATIRARVRNELIAYFQDYSGFETQPDLNGITSAINKTAGLTSFTMTLPASVSITDKYIAQLGTLTFL